MTLHKFLTNPTLNKDIDNILMRSKFTSFQEYIQWRVKEDTKYLKRSKNNTIG